MPLMKELELWSDIEGYEGHYQVSNLGRVRSLDRGMYVRQDRYKQPRWTNRKGKILNIYLDGKGYQMVRPCLFGISKTLMVHRLVATAFVPNPDGKPAVNHINANHLDNRASNLEWCTTKENNHHTIKLGRKPYANGSMGLASKLNADQVKIIKSLILAGEHDVAIAKQFNVSRTNIFSIRKGNTWTHI